MRQQAPTVAARLGGDPDILQRRGVGEDIGDLVRPGDTPMRDPVGSKPGDLPAIEQDAPGGRPQDAGQAVEERALAGAVWADDRADLLAPDRKIDLVERGQSAKADSQILSAQKRVGEKFYGHLIPDNFALVL